MKSTTLKPFIELNSSATPLQETNMLRLLLLPIFLCIATTLADDSDAQTSVLKTFDRAIVKEPNYESTPKYSLIILGASGKMKVWMVEDGKRLYVDKNANGDLTDDTPPIEPSDVRRLGDDRWDFNYLLDAITPDDGSRHTHFNLRRWNYGDKDDSYGLSISLDGQVPMYAGWFGTFWSMEPETAPIIHFGGPLTPKMLREKEFVIGSGPRRLSMALINPGSDPGAESRLSIDALPPHIIPRLEIDWPTPGDDRTIRTSHDLTERCCYWEFYTTAFKVPDGIVDGTAKVLVQLPEFGVPLELTTTEIEVPVVKPTKKSED
ncbi:MAG: hypothetical protein ACYC4B_29550 [Pirellulaceae bacterium]